MADFWIVLSFSAIPLGLSLVFALLAPALGASLYLRNEVLLGIALPPAGSAAIALAVVLGVDGENHLALFALTVMLLFLLTLALPLGMKRQISLRRREIVLAAVLVLGNALTLGVMALSPRAESHLKYLLSGELMAAGMWELISVGIAAVLLLGLGYAFRGAFFAFTLDEEHFRLLSRHYTAFRITYRLTVVLVITAALMLTGPVLCAALLLLPALFAEGRISGMERYALACSLVGLSGTLLGFMAGIAADLPPAPTAAVGMAVVGVLFKLLAGFKGKTLF